MLSVVLPSVESQYHRQRYQPCGEGSWQCFPFLPLPSSHLALSPEPACPVEVLSQLYQKLICLALNLEMTMGDFYLIPVFHNTTIFRSFKAKILASSWWDRLCHCWLCLAARLKEISQENAWCQPKQESISQVVTITHLTTVSAVIWDNGKFWYQELFLLTN